MIWSSAPAGKIVDCDHDMIVSDTKKKRGGRTDSVKIKKDILLRTGAHNRAVVPQLGRDVGHILAPQHLARIAKIHSGGPFLLRVGHVVQR